MRRLVPILALLIATTTVQIVNGQQVPIYICASPTQTRTTTPTSSPTPTRTPLPAGSCCQHSNPDACGLPENGTCGGDQAIPNSVCNIGTGFCISTKPTPVGIIVVIVNAALTTPTPILTSTPTPTWTPLPPGYCCQKLFPHVCGPPQGAGVNCAGDVVVENAGCDGATGSCIAGFFPTPIPNGCTGDCNLDGYVDLVEYNVCISILLGASPVSACPTCDVNRDGEVDVGELTVAFNIMNAGSCPGVPTRTPTVGATPTRVFTPPGIGMKKKGCCEECGECG